MPSLIRRWGLRVHLREPTVTAMSHLLERTSSGFFDLLPVEIIQQMASRFPLSSSAALTLCNKKIYHILGNQYLLTLGQTGSSDRERVRFLKALDRDILEAFYCLYCKKLHLLTGIYEQGLTDEEMFKRVSHSRCLGSDATYNYGTTYTHHTHFKFEHVQMAMNLYRRGLASRMDSYLRFSAMIKPTLRSMTSLPGSQGFYFFEPRFVYNQICVHAQSLIFISKNQGTLLPRMLSATVCSHLDTNLGNKNRFVETLRFAFEHLSQNWDSSAQCQNLIRCNYCPTEVQVETKGFGEGVDKKFLVITKWQALGQGLSPLGSWESHLQPRSSRWS